MSSFCLKIIATIAMTLHHIEMCIGQVGLMDLFPAMSLKTGFYIMTAFEALSRVSFPIFAFLLAEGSGKTSSMPKYIKRLALTAFISEPVYYLAFSPLTQTVGGFLKHFSKLSFDNVFFTLALGAIAIYCYQKAELRKTKESFLLFSVILLLLSYIASFVHSSYGGAGVILIMALYLARKKFDKGLIIFIWSMVMYILLPAVSFNGFRWEQVSIFDVINLIFSVLSVLPIYLYNGKRGKAVKWSFYVYYPVHIIILILVKAIISVNM